MAYCHTCECLIDSAVLAFYDGNVRDEALAAVAFIRHLIEAHGGIQP